MPLFFPGRAVAADGGEGISLIAATGIFSRFTAARGAAKKKKMHENEKSYKHNCNYVNKTFL
jgi:hypothetical protein